MTMRGVTAVLAGLALLAGCSDGGSSEDRPTFDELQDRGLALGSESETAGAVPGGGLPTGGTATYEGVIAIASPNNLNGADRVNGELTLQFDFDGGPRPSGSATNFVSDGDEEFDGTLTVSNGTPLFGAYTADIDGTLTDEDDGTYQIDGDLIGGFRGETAEYARGEVEGDLSIGTEGSDVILLETFDGEFVAVD